MRGEFVTVIVDAEDPAPEGWCYCQVARESLDTDGPSHETEEGLVPWFFLVSAAHAEHQAVFQPVTPPGMPLEPDGGGWLEVTARRGDTGALGLDINDYNC